MIYVGYLFMPSNLVWFARRRCAFGDRGPSKDQSIVVVVVGPSVDRRATPLVGSRSCHVGTNRMIYRAILVLHDSFPCCQPEWFDLIYLNMSSFPTFRRRHRREDTARGTNDLGRFPVGLEM